MKSAQKKGLLLTLDIGTSSTRAALFDERCQRIVESTAQKTYPLLTDADGRAEIEPQALLDAVLACISETLLYRREEPSIQNLPIIGIGMSCFWHSLIGVSPNGTPLTRIITWADSRCREDAALLRKRLDERTAHRLTGCMLRASFWPAKMRWLKRTQPAVFKAVSLWLTPAEWLQAELTQRASCAIGMATSTGIFNPSTLRWEPTLLKACDLNPVTLPPVHDLPTPVEGPLAEMFPELANVPWFPGIGDGAASNLGSGATEPGLAAINVGTSAALRVMKKGRAAKAPFGLFAYRVDSDRYLVGGAVSNAGSLRAWALSTLNLPEENALEAALAKRHTPNHGLTALPNLTTERAPTWNEDVSGTITGLTAATTPLDILQALTESTYHRIGAIAALLGKTASGQAPKYLVSGGIQKSIAAMQHLANCVGAPMYVNPEPEASIRGAAVFVAEKLGLKIPAAKPGKAIKPKAGSAAAYAEARKRQMTLETVLTGFPPR
jgi:gluconokinase